MAWRWMILGAVAITSPVTAAQYLETVQSGVFQASGDHAALAKRAAACLARNAGAPGQTIQTDADGGTAVGVALFSYNGLLAIPWSVKSVVTVETKDGRFRITHSGIVQKQGGPATHTARIFYGLDDSAQGGWLPVGMWKMSGHDKIERAAQTLSGRIAACIQSADADNW